MSNSLFASLTHVARSRDPSVELRRAKRDLVDMVSHVTMDGRSHGVRVINISPLGLMCRVEGDIPKGGRVKIWLPILKDVPAEIRWVEDNRVGMEFIDPIEMRIYDALLTLIPPRRTAW